MVVEGQDTGASFRIDDLRNRRALLGQGPKLARGAQGPDRLAPSRRDSHLEGEAIRVLDLGSRNGTSILSGRMRRLALGGEIDLGHTEASASISMASRMSFPRRRRRASEGCWAPVRR